MRDDYVITIFCRQKGKTRSFSLERRLVHYALFFVLLVALIFLILGYTFFQGSQERRQLQAQVAQLEQSASKLAERLKAQEAAAPVPQEPATEAALGARIVGKVSTPGASQDTSSTARKTSEALASLPAYAKIDSLKVSPLEEGLGFQLDFKLSNLRDTPISGAMAIIASRKSPTRPCFVSWPPMELAADGLPAKLRKSLSFYIRNFKYVAGKFYFPFSLAESFRILIYSPNEQLVFDTTILAEEVDTSEMESQELSGFLDPDLESTDFKHLHRHRG